MTDGCFIYVWTFADAQSYVGKARGIDRLAEYTNNLLKRRAGKPYRASDPGWRAVHDRMYEAHLRGEAIGLRLIPSTPDKLLEDERHWKAKLRPNLNDQRRASIAPTGAT